MTSFQQLFCLGITWLFLNSAVSLAQDDAAYQKIFDEVARHGAQLKTGVFRARGEFQGNPQNGLPKKGELEFFGAFDFPAGKVRFDRQLTCDEKLLRADDGGGQYIRTPGELITFACYLDNIKITSPEAKAPGWIEAIDIRGLGLSGYGDIMHSQSFDWVLANYRKLKGFSIYDEGEGIIRLEWNHDGHSLRQSWLDKNKSYAVVRHVITIGGKRNGEQKWNKNPIEDHQLKYAEKNKVWVPVEWNSVAQSRTELMKFEWESVNEPVDGTLFTAHGLNVKRANRILDDRSGKIIVLQDFRP